MTEEIRAELESFYLWLCNNDWAIAKYVDGESGLIRDIHLADLDDRPETFDSLLRDFERSRYDAVD